MNFSAVELANLAAPATFGGPANERTARIAARRDFVAMKQAYMAAASDISGDTGARLMIRLRAADEPWELWSVRAVILASLPAGSPRTEVHRSRLQREFDTLFGTTRG
jgi:hypothetical protein